MDWTILFFCQFLSSVSHIKGYGRTRVPGYGGSSAIPGDSTLYWLYDHIDADV
jgi:hypothetical protein